MKKVLTLLSVSTLLIIQISCTDTKPEHAEINRPDSLDLNSDVPLKDSIIETAPSISSIVKGKDGTIKFELSSNDKSLLSWIDTIQLGTTYNELKNKFPEIGTQKPEGNSEELAKKGLTEAILPINLLERKGSIEFNFKNDSLYSFFYILTEPDFDKADDIYYGLQNFYGSKIGAFVEEKVEEHNRYSKSCYWESKKYNATMTYNMNSNTISWGIQNK